MHSYILQISNISTNLNEYKKLLNNCLDKESMSFELQCPICCINKVNIFTNPCGHTLCNTCADNMSTTCFICRSTVTDKLKLYLLNGKGEFGFSK